jgi:hypothetical protein
MIQTFDSGGKITEKLNSSIVNFFLTFTEVSIWHADPVAMQSEAQALIARTLDRGFESHLRHGCLSSSFYVVLSCAGRGLATS